MAGLGQSKGEAANPSVVLDTVIPDHIHKENLPQVLPTQEQHL